MKKTKLFSAMAILTLVSLGSCKNEEVVSSPIYVDNSPKANISGYVTAEMNLQTNGAEFVPAGTQLFVEVNYSDLNSAATGKWKDTVTVSATGQYQVDVPANGSGVTVTITPITFEANQIQAYGSFFSQTNKIYSTNPITLASVRTGQSLKSNITYSLSDLPNFTDKVGITGKVQANLDASVVGLENVPNGTVINFWTSTWKDSVIVQNGIYSIVAPKNSTINWKSKFKYLKNVWNPNTLTYNNSHTYEYTITGSSPFSSNTTDFDLSAGEGIDLWINPLANVVQVSGAALAELDLTISGLESIPDNANAKITFYTSDNSWGGTATISAGRYTINVPRNQTINYTGSFTYLKRTSATTTVQTTYSFNGSFLSSLNSTQTYPVTAN